MEAKLILHAIAKRGVALLRLYGTGDVRRHYVANMDTNQRMAFERALIAAGHPLAFAAGSGEGRYLLFVEECVRLEESTPSLGVE